MDGTVDRFQRLKEMGADMLSFFLYTLSSTFSLPLYYLFDLRIFTHNLPNEDQNDVMILKIYFPVNSLSSSDTI